jgi:hypothetical protein
MGIGRTNCVMGVDCAAIVAYINNPLKAFCSLSLPVMIRYNSCFDPETRIRLADGTWKAAGLVVQGDRLLNPVTGEAVRVDAPVVGPEKFPLWQIAIGDKSFRATDTHPVLTPEGPKQLREIRVGDEVLGEDGEFHEVEKVGPTPMREGQRVVNFNLSTYHSRGHWDHWISAEGIVAGDNALQLRMMRKRNQIPVGSRRKRALP